MALSSDDIKSFKSIAANSDGGGIDTSREIASGVDNNLYPDWTAAETLSGATRYRKFFRKNTSGTDAWTTPKTYIKQQPAGDTLSLGLGLDHADDDAGAQGDLLAWTASALVALVSDGADTRQVTLVGEDASGNRQTENVTLNGAVEVLSTGTYSRLYHAFVASLDATRTVTVKQGTGGASRGTIGPNKKITFRFYAGTEIDALAKGAQHGTIAIGGNFGLWLKLVCPANRPAARGVNFLVTSEGA